MNNVKYKNTKTGEVTTIKVTQKAKTILATRSDKHITKAPSIGLANRIMRSKGFERAGNRKGGEA